MADSASSQQDALEVLHDRFLIPRYDDGLPDTADYGDVSTLTGYLSVVKICNFLQMIPLHE